MVKVNSTVYDRTNSALLAILNAGILRERKDISQLSRQEKSLKRKVMAESNKLSKSRLGKKRTNLSFRIRGYKHDLQQVKRDLRLKQNLLKHSQKTLNSLKQEILSKQDNLKQAGSDLRKSLLGLMQHRRAEILKLRTSIHGTDKILAKLKSERAKVIMTAIKSVDSELHKLEEKKLRVAHSVEKHEHELQDLESLQQTKYHLRLTFREQLARLNSLENQLKSWSQKKLLTVKKISSENRNLQLQAKTKANSLQSFQNELADITKHYQQKLSTQKHAKQSLQHKLVAITQKKRSLTQTMQRDQSRLSKIHAEILTLSQNLTMRERNDSAKVKFLLLDIRQQKQQLIAGKVKISEISSLINKVKSISMGSKSIMDSFNKEKIKARTDLSRIGKDITGKQRAVKDIQRLLSSYKTSISAKITRVRSSQRTAESSNSAHQKLLDSVNSEFLDLHRTLMETSKKIVSTDTRAQKSLMSKKLQLSQEMSRLAKIMGEKTKAHKATLAAHRLQKQKLSTLDKSAQDLMQQLHRSKKQLRNSEHQITRAKQKGSSLEKEQILLQKIIDKISDESSVRKILGKSSKVSLVSLSTRRVRLAAELRQYVTTLQKHLKSDEKRHLGKISRKVGVQLRSKQRLYSAIKAEQQKTYTAIATRKSQFNRQKTHLQQELRDIRGEAQQSRSTIKASSKQAWQDEHVIHSLNERIHSSMQRRSVINKLFQTRDQHLTELNTLVKDKISRIAEKNKLQQELHKLHLMIDNKFEVCQVKTRIIKEIKRIPVQDTTKIKPALKTIDRLLGKLPKKEIDKFAKSKDFKIYQKVMKKYGVK